MASRYGNVNDFRAGRNNGETQARRDVFIDLFGQGARLVLSGLCLGLTAAITIRGVIAALLFGIGPGDPLTYAAAAIVFAGVAVAAVAIPARHAACGEPIRALRCE